MTNYLQLPRKSFIVTVVSMLVTVLVSLQLTTAQQTAVKLPSEALKFGVFQVQFDPQGTFKLSGDRWPTLEGTWKATGNEIELIVAGGPEGCDQAGRYKVRTESTKVGFNVISDPCEIRRVIVDRSTWSPASEVKTIPTRAITLTRGTSAPVGRTATISKGSWPSFRGPGASGIANGQNLPDKWDPKTGENILWRTPIPGLAHSSPIVWSDRIFVTTAVSSDPKATFRPGLYGDGDASKDRSRQRWMLYSIDKRTGKIIWGRLAFEGEPLEQRHIKSTYANSTPATDGRIVVAWFGSEGVYAYDFDGHLLWKVNLVDWMSMLTTFRLMNGDQQTLQSFGTTWSSCNATPRLTRSS